MNRDCIHCEKGTQMKSLVNENFWGWSCDKCGQTEGSGRKGIFFNEQVLSELQAQDADAQTG